MQLYKYFRTSIFFKHSHVYKLQAPVHSKLFGQSTNVYRMKIKKDITSPTLFLNGFLQLCNFIYFWSCPYNTERFNVIILIHTEIILTTYLHSLIGTNLSVIGSVTLLNFIFQINFFH